MKSKTLLLMLFLVLMTKPFDDLKALEIDSSMELKPQEKIISIEEVIEKMQFDLSDKNRTNKHPLLLTSKGDILSIYLEPPLLSLLLLKKELHEPRYLFCP